MLLVLTTLLFGLYASMLIVITTDAIAWLLDNLGAPPLIVTYPIIGEILCWSIIGACFAFLGWLFVTHPPIDS